MPRQPEPQYYTPREAAKILRVDPRTVYEWLRLGKLSGVKFGRSWRIPAKVVRGESLAK
jgi:excisionase family DNA binding protein